MALPDAPQEFTHSDRIKQLNDIDKDVARLLQSAGSALKALMNKPLPNSKFSSPSSSQEPLTLQSQQDAFTTAATQYFSLLSSIDVRLRRQVYALEEADIIAPEAPSKNAQTSFASTATGTSGTSGGKSSIYGGQGILDVGSLNSKKDSVGRDMEAELWRETRDVVEGIEGRGTEAEDGKKAVDSMELDSSPT